MTQPRETSQGGTGEVLPRIRGGAMMNDGKWNRKGENGMEFTKCEKGWANRIFSRRVSEDDVLGFAELAVSERLV